MLRIDPSSGVPPYEQLRGQLLEQMRSGALPPGSRLPAVRRLASDLGLAPNTVARTYRELEAAGFVRTAGRNGTVVAEPNDGPDVAGRALQLSMEYASAMRALGLGLESASQYLRRGYAELGAR
ncbi:GntR family transcriptional regulator [Enemella dayhoffiae]|uniref:GntR family transcriptional regulator n=1 Tax=Enemella dayhoffiae TaxID=2016507 RepID=A0A255HFJ8_9ACTN|nr:GntR family transcriptional regulator [Enemella dayhoffiae]OYO25214.1 GntR family transcriptional regulator [Enemella dayhoffiae]